MFTFDVMDNLDKIEPHMARTAKFLSSMTCGAYSQKMYRFYLKVGRETVAGICNNSLPKTRMYFKCNQVTNINMLIIFLQVVLSYVSTVDMA